MDNKFIRVDEVAQELSISKPYAYKLIKKLNDELKEQGFITIEGGHRVGMTGQAIIENGKVKNLKHISSVNVRMSHEVLG